MIKTYKKEYDYSYCGGFFPTFELLKNKKEQVKEIYVNEDALNSEGYLKLFNYISKDKIIVSKNIFNKLKEKENDHVISVFNKYSSKLETNKTHVVLVNPSDMGNLGNIMRSMLALDYYDLAIIKPACDIFNPKVIRSSMGAIFSIRFQMFNSFEEYMNMYNREYYPFMLQTDTYLHNITKPKDNKYALVFGNEATGLDNSFLNKNAVKIEQSNKVDSLNLATAVVLGLYYFKY